MKKEIIKYGQSLYDFVVQNYGSLKYIKNVVRNNTGIKYDALINQGDTLSIDINTGNNFNKSALRRKNITIVNNIQNNAETQLALFEDEVGILFEDGVGMIWENVYILPYTGVKYGYLYNWFVTQQVGDTGLTSSDDWVVPTDAQWTALVTYLGGASVAGGKLKETGLTYWNSPNTAATNVVGFNARGGGARFFFNGLFYDLQVGSYWWSSAEFYESSALYIRIDYDKSEVSSEFDDKLGGLSIRLANFNTTLTHGQTGTYTGNDGKIYRTICIDTVEYLADNLAETQFRDGSSIANVTDNTAWARLSTGAKCAYDNDESNVLI